MNVEPIDVGAEALRIIHERLSIDEAWVVRRARGFTWWPGRLEHQVEVGRPVREGGLVLTRITSRIPVLQDVRASREVAEEALAEWNRDADSYCYVYDPELGTVDSVQSAFTCLQTLDWHPRALGLQFAVQLEHADVHAEPLAQELSAQLMKSGHPERGKRVVRDSVLRVVDREILAAGQSSSRFADKSEFDAILKRVHHGNAASLGTNETGMCIEVPFGTWTALVTLYAASPQPGIGYGLGRALRLPIFTTLDECARLAAWLNRKEADCGFLADHAGAWGVMRAGQRHSVAHRMFTPNALYRPGIAMRIALQGMRKLELVNRLLNPGVPEPRVWELISKRLGLELPAPTDGGEVKFALPN